MAITKTSRTTRSNTSVPFYTEAGRAAFIAKSSDFPAYQTIRTITNTLIEPPFGNGKLTRVETVSDDGLTQTRVFTYADLETLSTAESAYGIAAAVEFQNYRINNGFTVQNSTNLDASQRANVVEITGIDAPYTVTTTYTFPSASDAYIDTFVGALENYNHNNKLTDLVINGANVVVTHQYLNSADQTAYPYLDMFFVPQLAEKGVTRTVVYAMV
jgi:hypothetical protein